MSRLVRVFKTLQTYDYRGPKLEEEFVELLRDVGEYAQATSTTLALNNERSFVYQPNGKQNSPDFSVINTGNELHIEIKSSKTGAAMWNSGYPRTGRVYVLTTKSSDKFVAPGTTFLLGDTLLTPEETERLDGMLARGTALKNEFNEEFRIQNHTMGVQHVRIMYQELITKNAQWLRHPDRQQREQDVLDRVYQFDPT